MTPKENGESPGPLRFYVAGSFSEKEKMRDLMDMIERIGHEISFDWTTHQSISPYEKHLGLAAKYTEEDIEGATNCDVFILISSKTGGSTQFIELGAAIVTKTVKKIFIVGPHNKRSMSFFHPKVERVNSVEEVFTKLFPHG